MHLRKTDAWTRKQDRLTPRQLSYAFGSCKKAWVLLLSSPSYSCSFATPTLPSLPPSLHVAMAALYFSTLSLSLPFYNKCLQTKPNQNQTKTKSLSSQRSLKSGENYWKLSHGYTHTHTHTHTHTRVLSGMAVWSFNPSYLGDQIGGSQIQGPLKKPAQATEIPCWGVREYTPQWQNVWQAHIMFKLQCSVLEA